MALSIVFGALKKGLGRRASVGRAFGKRTGRIGRTGVSRAGRGGAKRGHEFFGNQWTKVSRYSRKKKRVQGTGSRPLDRQLGRQLRGRKKTGQWEGFGSFSLNPRRAMLSSSRGPGSVSHVKVFTRQIKAGSRNLFRVAPKRTSRSIFKF